MNDGNFSWYITKSHQKSGRIFTVDRFGIMSERIQSHDLTPNIYQLLLSHIGRVSVGREIDDDHLEILAYSDNRDDWPELSRMAKRENATHIKSVISEGVTVVE